MMKKEEKDKYESPQTRMAVVSLESGICASSASVKNPDTDNGRIEEHEVNTDFGFTFTDQNWDETGQTQNF